MADEALRQTTPSMPLAHAHDELADQVRQFHNDMLREGVDRLHPDAWVDRFQAWQNRNPLSLQYARTLKWLEEEAARAKVT